MIEWHGLSNLLKLVHKFSKRFSASVFVRNVSIQLFEYRAMHRCHAAVGKPVDARSVSHARTYEGNLPLRLWKPNLNITT